MRNKILKNFCQYRSARINIKEVTLDNFVTTDNLLQNKAGIEKAINLPPQEGNIPKYYKHDILVANIRPYLKKIWFADREGGCSADVLVFEVHSDNDPKFIYYALFRDDFFNHMMKGSKGTKMPRGDKLQILDFTIPQFSKPTQQKIAAVLSALDAKIELNNRINAELEAMAKTLYDCWFVQFDFPDQNGNPYKSSGGKMTYNPTLKRQIPYGWAVKTLGNVFKLYQPKTISEKEFDEFGDYFVYGANGIVGKYNKYNHESQQVALTCRGSTCGNLTKTLPFSWITGNAMVMAPINHTWDIEFTYNLAKNSNIHAIITGSGQPQITRANLEGLKCIIAKDNIIENYCKVTSPISSKRVTIQKQNQELTQVRDWLLPMLMNGQVIIK